MKSLEDKAVWNRIPEVFQLSIWKSFMTNLQLFSCLQLARDILRWGKVIVQTSLTYLILAMQVVLDIGQVLVLIF